MSLLGIRSFFNLVDDFGTEVQNSENKAFCTTVSSTSD